MSIKVFLKTPFSFLDLNALAEEEKISYSKYQHVSPVLFFHSLA
jgi:hypothetical protein